MKRHRNYIMSYVLTKCDFLLVKAAISIYQLAGTGQTYAVSFIQPLLRAEPPDFSKNQHNFQAYGPQKGQRLEPEDKERHRNSKSNAKDRHSNTFNLKIKIKEKLLKKEKESETRIWILFLPRGFSA